MSNKAKDVTEPRLLSIESAATSLGISSKHLRNLAERGEVRFVRLGRRVLVPREELVRISQAGTGP